MTDATAAAAPTARSTMTVSDEVAIQISKMNKWYGEFHVLRDINLTVNRGERIVICGPSGSGKSTLIRCINRLEEHQAGKIVVDGTELTSDLKNIDTIRKEVGMCFQHFNLFPHLTILENCTLAPIWVRKTPRREAEETARGGSDDAHASSDVTFVMKSRRRVRVCLPTPASVSVRNLLVPAIGAARRVEWPSPTPTLWTSRVVRGVIDGCILR